jgi:uncharacterized protein YjbI with pentapeptide repeats
MANTEHLERIRQGLVAWNQWRADAIEIVPDLSGAEINRASLGKADLNGANLSGAKLSQVDLNRANLSGAHLGKAEFSQVDLNHALLSRANLSGARLNEVKLSGADLSGADLSGADLRETEFSRANLSGADLSGANLSEANLIEANLRGANLANAKLIGTQLVKTDLSNATLTDCSIFGISAWKLKLDGAVQRNLVITDEGEPTITVDSLEVAQFIYLLLRNEKVRDVIDTMTSKAVLILGRFTEERKAVLDAIREELRKRNYLPILFDFDAPASRDVTGTVETLARMARFIIADLTDPQSIPHELATIVPLLRTTPVLPIRLAGTSGYTMFADYQMAYPWVLATHEYTNLDELISTFPKVIAPADWMAEEFRKRFSRIRIRKPPAVPTNITTTG